MSDNQIVDDNTAGLGPLAGLIGVWEGTSGTDVSPGMPDHMTTDTETDYHERWEFSLIEPAVKNHDQKLRQLVCDTYAWRGAASTAGKNGGEAFHAQRGYWIWDAEGKQLLNSFAVPRGITVNAGGTAEAGDRSFHLLADAGSEIFGICQNPFLIDSFKVVRYVLKLTLNDDDSFDYEQDTQLQIKGRGFMHHTDTNHLVRQS